MKFFDWLRSLTQPPEKVAPPKAKVPLAEKPRSALEPPPRPKAQQPRAR